MCLGIGKKKIWKFLQDNNFEIDLMYHRISFYILDKTI